MIQVLYKIFLAVIIALFVGFGINVFYEGPKPPDYNQTSEAQIQKEDCLTAAQVQEQKDLNQKQIDFQNTSNIYNRNVSVIAIVISILILILSLTLLAKIGLWSDGTLFGGLLTLVYGMIRGMASQDSRFQFIAVTAGLIAVLIIGYVKFASPEKDK